MDIKTNNKPRPVIYGYELTAKEREEFDYMDEDELDGAQFVRYKRELYHLADFVRIVPRARAVGFAHAVDDGDPLLSWSGIRTDSYFSGLVIRWPLDSITGRPDFDSAVIGLATC